MEEDFLLYPEAFALKELDSDIKCYGYFDKDGKFYPMGTVVSPDDIHFGLFIPKYNISNSLVGAPLYQQAFKWFRKNHSLYHNVWNYTHSEPSHKNIPNGFTFSIDEDWLCIVGKNPETGLFEKYYDSHEEAELACLQKLIELVKEKS